MKTCLGDTVGAVPLGTVDFVELNLPFGIVFEK